MPVLTGTAAANTLTGGNGADTITGLGGADSLRGNGGNDVLIGDGAVVITGYAMTGAEVLVNTTTNGQQGDPVITALTGGRSVVVWTDRGANPGDTDPFSVRGQIIDATGAKIGDEFVVNTSTASWQYLPSVTALTGGGFVVAFGDWSAANGDTSDDAIRAQLFDADGDKVGSEFLVNTTTAGSQHSPNIAALSDGGFVVVWGYNDKNNSTPNPINAQRYDATGNRVGTEFTPHDATMNGNTTPTSVTGLPGGGYVVVWYNGGTYIPATDSQVESFSFQILGADGTRIGPETLIETDENQAAYPQVAALTGGGFVVTWHDKSGSFGDSDRGGVVAQRFDASGAALGAAFLVNTQTDNLQDSPSIAALTSGGFVVVWTDQAGGPSGNNASAIVAQVFSAGGDKIGGEMLVNTTDSGPNGGNQYAPSVTALPNGGFTVTWADASGNDPDSDFGAIRAQSFTGTGAPVVAGDDTLDGGAGNDTLEGGGGHDRLLGGAGNDSLSGDAGNDDLDGGAGGDTLKGGAGNDTYATDGLDTLTEAAGAGTDLVESTATLTLGANFEHLTLTGTVAINGTGNVLANRITGNSAANTLNGAAGNDTLAGAGGADSLVGAAGNDVLEGAAGRDTMTGGAGADVFAFASFAETGNSASAADQILDFIPGTDRIDLSVIDASVVQAGNNAFVFIGGTAINTGGAGALAFKRFDQAGTANDYTLVYLDNDADTASEAVIRLKGLHVLSVADFVL